MPDDVPSGTPPAPPAGAAAAPAPATAAAPMGVLDYRPPGADRRPVAGGPIPTGVALMLAMAMLLPTFGGVAVVVDELSVARRADRSRSAAGAMIALLGVVGVACAGRTAVQYHRAWCGRPIVRSRR